MLNDNNADAIEALCTYARLTYGADLVLVLEVNEHGQAVAVGSAPAQRLGGFNLKHSGIFQKEWNGVPVSAEGYRLPMAIIHALGTTPDCLLYLPAPLEYASLSGMLFVWRKPPCSVVIVNHWRVLANALAALMALRKKTAVQNAISNQFYDLFETTPAGIIFVDGDGQEVTLNTRAARLLGCAPGVLTGDVLAQLMRTLREQCNNHAELDAAYATQIGNVNFTATLNWSFHDLTLKVATHPVRGDGEYGRIWILTDVTAEIMMAAELRRLATYDPLTGVPNRRQFEESSAQIITVPDTQGSSIAILMVDIDHFKLINDTYGHPVGDKVLQIIAKRCHNTIRERDLFARYGGEEFIALIAINSNDDIVASAERLRDVIASRPVQVDDLSIEVSISIGTASAVVGDQKSLEQLINQADIALYRAKKSGRNRVEVFS